MSRKGLKCCSCARLVRSESVKTPCLQNDSNAGIIGVSSPCQICAESNKRVRKLYQDPKKREKASGKYSISKQSETNYRCSRPPLSCLSHNVSSLMTGGAEDYPRSEHRDRSVSRQPDTVLMRALQSLEHKRKDKHSKGQARPLPNAVDSIELARKSLKLKNSKNFEDNRRNAELLRCGQKRSSQKSSQRSKSHALVNKPQSQSTLISETFGQSSLTSLGADKCVLKVCACLLFKAEVGRQVDAKVTKDEKKEKKGKIDTKDVKDTKHRTSEKNMKGVDIKCRKVQEKGTQHCSKHHKCEKCGGDPCIKTSQSLSEKSRNKDRNISKCGTFRRENWLLV